MQHTKALVRGLTSGSLHTVLTNDRPCFSVGNPANPSPQGGAFFLGVIAGSGIEFDRITLEALTPRDDSGEPTSFVPGWQVTGITFAPVPAPSTLLLVAAGLCRLAAACRIWRTRGAE